MQSILGFNSTVQVTSYQVPNSKLFKSRNEMEKLNELTSLASNLWSSTSSRQTSHHLAKDSAATNFLRDLLSSNYSMTAYKRKLDISSECGNIGGGSLFRGLGSPYHRNTSTRHSCSKREHMYQKQFPLKPSNRFNEGFLSSFVKSNFLTNDKMDESSRSQNYGTTLYCKHQCARQDTQLEKLAKEAKLKPYNTKLRLKALMGQKCSICQKDMVHQTEDHALRKEELDVSRLQRVNSSKCNNITSSNVRADSPVNIKLQTCGNSVTRRVVVDVPWKHASADRLTDGVNLQWTCSSPTKRNLETCNATNETKEYDSVDKREKNSQIDWFEYYAQGVLISDAIQPRLPVEISKPIDAHVMACDLGYQAPKSFEKKNEKRENKSVNPLSLICVEDLPDFAKALDVAPENSSLSTSKSDYKDENSVTGNNSKNGKDNEWISAENSKKMSDSDMSCVLYVRKSSASKKTRPSSKKRRRQKAKLQQRPQQCKDNPTKVENLSGSKTRALMLGMDSSPISNSITHSFLVSIDDGDSDWSDSDFEDTGRDDLCELQNSFGLMNLSLSCINGIVKESKPQTESGHEECNRYDLDAINLKWEINIPLNDRSSDQKSGIRKVQFANDKNLVTLHPMIAWSYAYAAARKGPWEEYARDRDRFQRRIEESECILSPILKPDHRFIIYRNYFEAE